MHQVVLTFDDGPHPRWTREILGVLDAARPVKATFFMWGEQAAKYPDGVGEVLRAGHSVQPHCWRHVPHPRLSAAHIRADIDRVSALLRRLGAAGPDFWRPPWGQLRGGVTRGIARHRGLQLVGWNADSHDWVGRPGVEMYTTVRARIAELEGQEAVVLMHDNDVEPRQARSRSGCQGTVDLVRRLIDDEQLMFAPVARGIADNLNQQPRSGWQGLVRRRSLWIGATTWSG